jgi:hypothetical protein
MKWYFMNGIIFILQTFQYKIVACFQLKLLLELKIS